MYINYKFNPIYVYIQNYSSSSRMDEHKSKLDRRSYDYIIFNNINNIY